MKSLAEFLVCSFLLLHFASAADSRSVVRTLPGFPGPLPFKLETGYIGVGDNEEVQLFYYVIESERDPVKDPLLLWFTGGPGCSAFSGLAFEIGPLNFELGGLDGRFSSLLINPYSWTKVASIIFVDTPVGSGFSYSTTQQGYISSDTKAVQHSYMFLRKWLSSHPEFLKNWLYIAGDSYAGKIVPMVTLAVAQGNEAGLEPRMLLQGYIVGNPVTDPDGDDNERVPYIHRMGLVSDKYFELAKKNCHGKYVNPDPENFACLYALRFIDKCVKHINNFHILEPSCLYKAPKPYDDFPSRKTLIEDVPIDLISISPEDVPCRDNLDDLRSSIWANNETVQEALHIRKGTILNWARCNKSLSYDYNVGSVLEDHRLLNEKGFQTLAYSGDHDMVVPYLSTLKWIRKLNVTIDDKWRPWTVDGQVAGYTEVYKNNQAFITFATVKGAGHTAPEYRPKECLEMIKRWLALYPI